MNDRVYMPLELVELYPLPPYPSRSDSALYSRLKLQPTYSQRPPQPAAVSGMWCTHPVPRPLRLMSFAIS